MHDATTVPVRLHVLGSFALVVHGEAVELPLQAKRVLGYLAVAHPTESRSALAGRLWGEMTERRAMATLRNALWRLRMASAHVIRTSGDGVAIEPNMWVDLAYARRRAEELAAGRLGHGHSGDVELFGADLLSGWDEDWLSIERERLRQMRIHALESLAEVHIGAGRYDAAIQAALAAIRAEPLRESAQIVLIRAHLGEGNPSEALRQFESYGELLRVELGIEPSARVASLLRDRTGRMITRVAGARVRQRS